MGIMSMSRSYNKAELINFTLNPLDLLLFCSLNGLSQNSLASDWLFVFHSIQSSRDIE